MKPTEALITRVCGPAPLQARPPTAQPLAAIREDAGASRRFLLLSPLLLASIMAPPGATAPGPQEGKLDRVRDEVKTSRLSVPDDEHEDEDDGLALGFLFSEPIAKALLFPFHLPQVWLGDDSEREAFFADYPYEDRHGGYLRLTAEEPPSSEKSWALRLLVEGSTDFDDLERANVGFLLEGASRFGVQGSLSYIEEDRSSGRKDRLTLGDINLVYRFAQSEWAQFRTGIGVNLIFDDAVDETGFNFTYGADFYPVDPLVITTALDLGSLGSASVFHWRATAGYQLRHLELYIGYDHREIGGVDLYGPVAGMRIQF